MSESMVSIIMPCYNAESYIGDAISSVLAQDYQNLELIVINDGSTDNSGGIVQGFGDHRVVYLEQENQGVSVARNAGINASRGIYMCFLDADDVMLPGSLSVRVAAFKKDTDTEFVTGGQEHWNETLTERLYIQLPDFEGNPKRGLARLDGNCFVNCGALMIRKVPEKVYEFPQGWSHCEDLAFFFKISGRGTLYSIPEPVQKYRRHHLSAMSHLQGLEDGYRRYYRLVKGDPDIPRRDVWYLKWRIMRIMTLSYLHEGHLADALLTILRMSLRWK